MKLYLGIKQNNSLLYIIAINSKGETVLKTRFPAQCSQLLLINFIKNLQNLFTASIRISACIEKPLIQTLVEPLKKSFPSVKLFNPSIYYSTNILPEENPYQPNDPYKNALLLTIMDSLDQ